MKVELLLLMTESETKSELDEDEDGATAAGDWEWTWILDEDEDEGGAAAAVLLCELRVDLSLTYLCNICIWTMVCNNLIQSLELATLFFSFLRFLTNVSFT